jgi:hypothetical protein
VSAAEDVERQIAVAVIIAKKEPALLMAVQRVIGGIQIEKICFGNLPCASRNSSTSRASIAAGSWLIL